jgi:hypothetical protein
VDRDGEPFGDKIDYGTFVIHMHQKQPTGWWQTMYERYGDPLSRRTWSLALLATAGMDIVTDHLERIDACLTGLTADEFFATASSSSRLGAMQTHRRLDTSVWATAADLSTRTKILIGHFTANLSRLDPLDPLPDFELERLSSPEAASWPIARAITSRLLERRNSTLLNALARLGADTPVDIPSNISSPGSEVVSAILAEPARYPGSWVAAAELWHSRDNEEVSLEQVALDERWLPKIPRL